MTYIDDKIFCIGYPRTGTTSLHLYFVMHGVSSIHYPIQLAMNFWRGNYNSGLLDEYDAFTDLPIPLFYRELSKQFPSARFILTTRNSDDWMESARIFFESRNLSGAQLSVREAMRIAAFGRSVFEANHFKGRFERHNEDAARFFCGSERFMCVNLADAGVKKDLDSFLKLPDSRLPIPKVSDPAIGKFSAVSKANIASAQKQLINLLSQESEN